jgi:hypothetical protein
VRGRDHGQLVKFQAACEGVDVREAAGPRGLGPVFEPGIVRGVWPEQGGEGADEPGEVCHLGAGGGQAAEQRPVTVAEGVRPDEQEPDDPPG